MPVDERAISKTPGTQSSIGPSLGLIIAWLDGQPRNQLFG